MAQKVPFSCLLAVQADATATPRREIIHHLRKRSFLECFPYVCPEPVLVKRSVLHVNGFKRPFSHQ